MTDLHLTADGHIVCIHDENTRRVARDNLIVRNTTLERLRQLDVGSANDARFQGERIPTLAEVLQTVPAGKFVYLDIKTDVEIIPPLIEQLRNSRLQACQIVILAFDAEVIREIKNHAPEFRAHWLCRVRRNRITCRLSPGLEDILDTLRESGADGLASRHTGITDEFVRAVIDAGFEHRVWTVNDVRVAERFAALGSISIITNVPATMLGHWHSLDD